MERQFVGEGEVQAVRKQLKALDERNKGNDTLVAQAAAFSAQLQPLVEGDGELAALKLATIGGQLAALQTDLEGSDRSPTQPQRDVFADCAARLEKALAAWTSIKTGELPRLNAALKTFGLPVLEVPTRAQIQVVDSGVSREMP